MSTLYSKSTHFESKLDKKKDISLTIDGFPTVIELSYHGIKRIASRGIFESAITHMVQQGFDTILDLHRNERFILINKELGISVVGAICGEADYILVSIISVMDSSEPYNPHHTLTIAV